MEQIEQFSFDFQTETPHIVRQSRDEIQIQMGEFAGPLDLLLYLIKQEQANIFDIPIARITDEYLKYIRLIKSLDISLAADFLVMAATLIEIKSKMLLPREISGAPDEEEIEDPRRELVDRLLEYETYKNASQMLWTRSTVEQAIFTRGQIESDENNLEVNSNVFDLLKVFQKILAKHKEETLLEIEREEMSLAEMLKKLKAMIKERGHINLLEFLRAINTRREIILAFIAVLELVRTGSVTFLQKDIFGDIVLTKSQ